MRPIDGGGMRALPGPPSSGGGGVGRGYGGGPAGEGLGALPQPGLWAIPAGVLGMFVLVAWGVDLGTAAWCHFDGCVSTSYLPKVLWGLAALAAVVIAVPVAYVGHRLGWWACALRWARWVDAVAIALVVLAVRRTRAAAAARARRRAVERTTVAAVASDAPRAIPAERAADPEVVDVEVLIGGVWMSVAEAEAARDIA
jgi:hypothetical protein